MKAYASYGAPPEIQAYALAKYSRSSQSMSQSIEELSAQRAEQFLDTFYFQYGHRSIADLAHVTMAIENCSLLAEFYITDESLWDGQSRSTRYQNFHKNNFYIPQSIAKQPELLEPFRNALHTALDNYRCITDMCIRIIEQVTPKPDAMDPTAYKRTVKARAFDVGRYFLPLATHTSVGQITSARVLEQQIVRLNSLNIPELTEIAEAMRMAARNPADNFVAKKIQQACESTKLSTEQTAGLLRELTETGILETPAAPTLVKYTAASSFQSQAAEAARNALRFVPPERAAAPSDIRKIILAAPETDPLEAFAAEIIYLTEPNIRYPQALEYARRASNETKTAAWNAAMELRGEYDELLRIQRIGYMIVFDMLIDFGALRDFHRHRRCLQIIPQLGLDMGFDAPADIFSLAFGPKGAEIAQEMGLFQEFSDRMEKSIATAAHFPDTTSGLYLAPLGARQRAVFKMDIAEAVYIAELRSKPGGHFSYRHAAWQMAKALTATYPFLKNSVRAVNPFETLDLLNR